MRKSQVDRFMESPRIQEALHNLAPSSGASDEKCHGILIGIMSTLLAQDSVFMEVWNSMRRFVKKYPTERIPPAWRDL